MNLLNTSTTSFILIACSAAIILSAAFVRAEVIPASRVANWRGNAGVQGGIPNRTTIYTTLGPASTAAEINTAIASCPSGQVVSLSAGTYNLTVPIRLTKSNVTLRGAGPTRTFLKFSSGGNSFIEMSGTGYWAPQIVTNWTANYAQGATAPTITNSSGFKVGDLVMLDQLNDPNYIGLGTEGASDNGAGIARLQCQLSEITAISGNQVTISPGLYMPNWQATFSPRMWIVTKSKLQYTGVENLTVDGSGGSAQFNIYSGNSQNCWIKNVESTVARTSHFRTDRSKNIEMRDSFCHSSLGAGVGVYGIGAWTTTQLLIENNVLDQTGSLIFNNSAGCVISYNYVNRVNQVSNSGWMGYILANHNAHNCYNLFEGNMAPQIYSDYIHGSASHLTYFRNWLKGTEGTSSTNTHAVTIEMYNRYFNVVGNVLGNPSYHKRYEDIAPGTITETSIYKLGYRSTYTAMGDSLVASGLLRHGNYDAVTKAIVWDSSIAERSLSNSLYLTGKPQWFGNLSWPPFNPAAPNAAVEDIPAGVRFVNNANRLRNISTRGFVQGGDGVLIGGFIITGTGQKKVALRGMGPSLPLSSRLSDPAIELHAAGGALIAQNDNWRTPQGAEIAAAGLAPGNDREAALITTLNPGSYTVIVRGVGSATGIGLVEIYDLDATNGQTWLGNIASRGNVLGGDRVLIGGFIAGGGDWSPLVVARAMGPSLANAGISNVLADPVLSLHDSNGALIASNDDWKDGKPAVVTAAGLAPSDLREAVIATHLAPGNYTAIVSGKNGATGVGLVEIYSVH